MAWKVSWTHTPTHTRQRGLMACQHSGTFVMCAHVWRGEITQTTCTWVPFLHYLFTLISSLWRRERTSVLTVKIRCSENDCNSLHDFIELNVFNYLNEKLDLKSAIFVTITWYWITINGVLKISEVVSTCRVLSQIESLSRTNHSRSFLWTVINQFIEKIQLN